MKLSEKVLAIGWAFAGNDPRQDAVEHIADEIAELEEILDNIRDPNIDLMIEDVIVGVLPEVIGDALPGVSKRREIARAIAYKVGEAIGELAEPEQAEEAAAAKRKAGKTAPATKGIP